MHEYPITAAIIESAEKYMLANDRHRVLEIALVIGEYSGCVAESIEMYFDIIAEGTPCENAVLKIEKVKPMLKCKACGKYFERLPFSFECGFCGGDGEPTEIGREFYIKSITIE